MFLFKLLISGMILPWIMGMAWLVLLGFQSFVAKATGLNKSKTPSAIQKTSLGIAQGITQLILFCLLLCWAAWAAGLSRESIIGGGLSQAILWIIAFSIVVGPMTARSGNKDQDAISSVHVLIVGLGFIFFSIFPQYSGPLRYLTNRGMSQVDARNFQTALAEWNFCLEIYNSKEFKKEGWMTYTIELRDKEAERMQESLKKALTCLDSIEDSSLEAGHWELKGEVNTNFKPGLEALLEFTKTSDMRAEKKARGLLNKWGMWIQEHHKEIKIGKS